MSPDFLHPSEQHAWLHHDLLHLDRSIMALADAMRAMTEAVGDAVTEIRTLTEQIANTGDVEAATEQLNTLAANLEQAVTDAQAHPDHPDNTPPDGTEGTPPEGTPPGDTPPLPSSPV